MLRQIRVACVLILSIALGSCADTGRHAENTPAAATPTAPLARAAHPDNVLLVTLDATRADRIGAYGYAAGLTRAFDGVAKRGTLLENAYTACPLTLPAHSTLLTGLQPPEHGVRINGENALGPEARTLAEVLAEAGYHTGAFVASFVVNSKFGLDQGFDVYDDDLTGALEQDLTEQLSRYRPGSLVVDAALKWLEKTAAPGPGPFFAWVHLYDAHYPYRGHAELAGTKLEGVDSYDAEVAFADRQLGRLLAFLDARGLTDRTLVVVAGDHGEGLNDHGDIEHGHLLNEETLHIPLVFALPGLVKAGQRVSAIVSLRDVFPTILEVLGIRVAPAGGGRSLAPALRGKAIDSQTSYSETDFPYRQFRWSSMRSVTTDGWKFVRSARPELYDRRDDRGELFNLATARPDVARRLDAELRRIEATWRKVAAPARVKLSEAARARLEALGYGNDESAPAPTPPSGGTNRMLGLKDIKDMLPIKHLETDLMRGIEMKVLSPKQILDMSKRLVEASPETPRFQNRLGGALMDLGRHQEAAQYLEKALELAPGLTAARHNLARTYARLGRSDDAMHQIERLLAIEPESAALHREVANVLTLMQRLDAALGHYKRALDLDPDAIDTRFQMADVLARRDRSLLAAAQYRRILEKDPDQRIARFQLARVLAAAGHNREAAAQYENVLRREPRNVDALNNLGVLLAALDKAAEAEKRYREAIAVDANFARPRYNLGNLMAAGGRESEAVKQYEEALRLRPDWAQPMDRLAWMLATAKDSKVRNAKRAVNLGEKAAELTRHEEPRVLFTLARAYAAAHRGDDAARTGARARGTALARNEKALAREIAAELGLDAASGDKGLTPPPAATARPKTFSAATHF